MFHALLILPIIGIPALLACGLAVSSETTPNAADDIANVSEAFRSEIIVVALSDLIDRARQGTASVYISLGFDAKAGKWISTSDTIRKRIADTGRDCQSVKGVEPPASPTGSVEQVAIFCVKIKKIDESLGSAEVSVFRFKGKLDSSGYLLLLKRVDEKWKVLKRTGEWTS